MKRAAAVRRVGLELPLILMNEGTAPLILVINIGSSSIKFALYQADWPQWNECVVLAGKLNRIGLSAGEFFASDPQGKVVVQQRTKLPSHEIALKILLSWLESARRLQNVKAVGHRVVYGGRNFNRPQLVSPALLRALKRLVPLDPDHMPEEIRAIELIRRLHPGLAQAVSFDSAFHSKKSRVAQLYGLPRALAKQGVLRYGFHGLSYEYIVQELTRQAGEQASRGRVIVAHLGNGASLAAIRNWKSVDTSMGFTPTSGIVMSTRSGDLDPGVVLYLLQEKRYSASRVRDVLTKKSGLLGLSGLSSDMKDLLEHEDENAFAREAIAVFCYQAKKYIGAYAAVLGGLDTLVFTGGIGENAPPIRQRICEGIECLGVLVDTEANKRNAPVISAADSPATVRVIQTNEELIIARHTRDVLTQRQASQAER